MPQRITPVDMGFQSTSSRVISLFPFNCYGRPFNFAIAMDGDKQGIFNNEATTSATSIPAITLCASARRTIKLAMLLTYGVSIPIGSMQ